MTKKKTSPKKLIHSLNLCLDSKASLIEAMTMEYDYRRLHTNQLLLRLHSPLIAALLNDLPPSPLAPGTSHLYQHSYHYRPRHHHLIDLLPSLFTIVASSLTP